MIKTLRDMDVKDKKVILRVDYNVPIENGIITNSKKIDDTFETLDYLVENGAKVIILSHFGRVKTEKDKTENSLRPVFEYIKDTDRYQIYFSNVAMGEELENIVNTLQPGELVLAQNTRFLDLENKMESNCDIQLSAYWARLGDIYIDDAFGSMHREHASVTGIPRYINKCGIGFLVEKELKYLKPLITDPQRPFIVVMGGAKLDDKIKLMYTLLEQADYILVGGGIANTFLKAAGYDVGSSLVSDEATRHARALMKEFPDKIILPKDVITSPSYTEEKYELKNIEEIVIDDVIGDIGSKAVENFGKILSTAKTIFLNGTVGMYEQKPFSNGTQEILNIISKTDAIKLIGGGDAGASVKKYKYEDKMDFISTGGGATLTYIGNKTLPGLEALETEDE